MDPTIFHIAGLRIGVFGNGRWSKIVVSALESFKDKCEVQFIADSSSPHLDQGSLKSIDWAFVLSSHETHFEIVKLCLKNGLNVFCEKPLTTSMHEAMELYELAEAQGVCLYVDDIFLWKDGLRRHSLLANKSTQSKWLKSGNPKECHSGIRLLKDLAYHHIYLLGSMYGFPPYEAKATKRGRQVDASIEFVGIKYDMTYSKSSKKTEHFFLGSELAVSDDGSLQKMLSYVLTLQKTPCDNKKSALWTLGVLRSMCDQLGKNIAVIGGGIFGCTTAIELAKNGHKVTLIEKKDKIMMQASKKNQLRCHRGYHYPRSDETARQCRNSEYKFAAYFGDSILNSNEHFYAIAKDKTKVNAAQYEAFMNKNALGYQVLSKENEVHKLFRDGVCEKLYQVQESNYDPEILTQFLQRRLKEEKVVVQLGSHINLRDDFSKNYDLVVGATYAEPIDERESRFEICEKPIVRLPSSFIGKSVVVLDGPFVSLDPHPSDKRLHLIGSVEDAILHVNEGKRPEIPSNFKDYLSSDIIEKPKNSNIDKFRKRFAQIYKLSPHDIVHHGSYFVVRVVEPNHDYDDRRISVASQKGRNLIMIFSAKVVTAPSIAQQVSLTAEND